MAMPTGAMVGAGLGASAFLIPGAGPLVGIGAMGLGATLGGMFDSANAGDEQAAAMQEMAQAQLQASREQIQFEKSSRDSAAQIARPSYDDLANQTAAFRQADITFNQQQGYLKQQQSLLDSVDPALKEAGVQAKQLLDGKEAAILGPIKQEMARQRNILENHLASQLGSGYATSSAGIEALSRYDQLSAQTLGEQQMNALNMLLGVSRDVRPNMNQLGAMASEATQGARTSAAAISQNQRGLGISAITGTPVNFNNYVNNAGANSMGALMRGTQGVNMGNQFMSMGAKAGGMALGTALTQDTLGKYMKTPSGGNDGTLGGFMDRPRLI
jgi:hypothetical protein